MIYKLVGIENILIIFFICKKYTVKFKKFVCNYIISFFSINIQLLYFCFYIYKGIGIGIGEVFVNLELNVKTIIKSTIRIYIRN